MSTYIKNWHKNRVKRFNLGDSMEISKAFSDMYEIFGELMPVAAKLYVLKLGGEDKQISQLLSEVIASEELDLGQIEQLAHLLQKIENSELGEEPQINRQESVSDEQLKRAVEILDIDIKFKSYGVGTVRIDGIPTNGMHRGPIILDEHKPSAVNKRRAPFTRYDLEPILSNIFHKRGVHGIKNKNQLQIFSEQISEVKVDYGNLGKEMITRKIAVKVLKLAYILNGECIMGLRNK